MKNLIEEKEIWRPIEGYPDYEISSFGNVRYESTKEIKNYNVNNGYPRIRLIGLDYINIHRLVARAFPEICGEWHEDYEVHHKDENRSNNHADNLVICTRKEHFEYHMEEIKERCQKITKKGELNHNYGKKFTEEHRRKIGDAQRGEKNHNYGKKASEETRKKMSDAVKGEKNPMWGKTRTDEEKRKISMGRKDKKPVLQYTLDGQLIREWESAMAVKRELGFFNNTISKCCKGKSNTAYGYKWKFKSDVENNK